MNENMKYDIEAIIVRLEEKVRLLKEKGEINKLISYIEQPDYEEQRKSAIKEIREITEDLYRDIIEIFVILEEDIMRERFDNEYYNSQEFSVDNLDGILDYPRIYVCYDYLEKIKTCITKKGIFDRLTVNDWLDFINNTLNTISSVFGYFQA